MEPERKIEKLLRAYAKKRRADTGGPLKLPPATRRMLQGEVARNAAKPDDEEASVTLWELFRQRWALFAGFALVIFFGAALFLPALSSSKKKAQAVMAMNNLKQISEPTNPGLPQPAAADDFTRGKIAETPAAITAASGTAAAAPTLDGLAKEVGAADKDFKFQTNAVQFAVTAAQNFQNYNSGAQNSFKNTAVPARAAVVLANFQVQQNGNSIRVVDADGSVYDGALQPENAVAQNEPARAVPPPAGALVEVDRVKNAAKQDEIQTAQNYFFRVTGTNLTLKQNVVFAGNLLANFSVNSNARQAPSGGFGGSQSQSVLTIQLPWSSSRIAGTAVVSDTNNIEINAVPQSP
jgi:hypothetical protein